MPERARIFWVEDNEYYFEAARELVELSGHTVVIRAETLDEALSSVPTLGERRIHVAIIDGNLSRGGVSCSDGANIACAIRENFPEVGIIGNSGMGDVDFADVQVFKGSRSPGLLRVIKDMPFPFRRV